MNRKQIMLLTQIFLMTVTAIFATIVFTGNARVWNIILFTVLTGVAWSFNMPARQATVPNLVPAGHLTNAVALNSAGFNLTRIVGPSLAGLMIAGVGLAGNFYLQAAAYVGVTLIIAQIQVPKGPSSSSDGSVWRNLAEGTGYVWHHPTVRSQMGMALIPVVLAMPYISLLPVFAKDILQVGPTEFGLLSAAPGIGALVGTLTIATIGNIRRKGRLLFGLLAALGLSLVAFSQSTSYPLSMALLVLVGSFQISYLTINHTLLQLTVPNEFRGQVMGIYLLNQGLSSLGSIIAGALAEIWSAPFAILTMGAAVLAFTGLAFALFPAMRKV